MRAARNRVHSTVRVLESFPNSKRDQQKIGVANRATEPEYLPASDCHAVKNLATVFENILLFDDCLISDLYCQETDKIVELLIILAPYIQGEFNNATATVTPTDARARAHDCSFLPQGVARNFSAPN